MLEMGTMKNLDTIHDIEMPKMKKWQYLVDILASIFEVPAGLIMRVGQENIEVLISSNSEGNPYIPGEHTNLGSGLYCETVMKTASQLKIADALQDENWNDNPDIKLGMISYLGVPLIWPDGNIFGTICVLDKRRREFSDAQQSLLWNFKKFIEKDFSSLSKTENERTNVLMAVEQTADPIIITDPKAIICYVNSSFEQNTGYSKQEIIGQNISILKSCEHDSTFFKKIKASLTNGNTWCNEITHKNKDGILSTNQISISPVVDRYGNAINYIGVIHAVCTQELSKD